MPQDQETLELYLAKKREQTRLLREPINRELREAGIFEDYVTFADNQTPKEAFPILAKHLKNETVPPFEMGVLARCFAQPEGHEYWDLLMEKFRQAKGNGDMFEEGLAAALGQACTTKEEIADVLCLMEDPSYGDVRLLLMLKLKKADMKYGLPLFQEICERLIETDPVVRPEIISWKTYWKKKNPAILEKWVKPKKAKSK